jgi:protein-disulfide isomerase
MAGIVNKLITGLLVVCALLMTVSALKDNRAPGPEKPRLIAGWEDLADLGITRGNSDAPVQIIEFVDLQCPFCARFHDSIAAVVDRYRPSVAWTFVHYPLAFHEQAGTAALASECAADQGRFWEFVDLALDAQDDFESNPWLEIAGSAGVNDLDYFAGCMARGPDDHPRIREGRAAGLEVSIPGTPAILVNGWLQPSSANRAIDSIVKYHIGYPR